MWSLLVVALVHSGLVASGAPGSATSKIQDFEAAALNEPALVQYLRAQELAGKIVWVPSERAGPAASAEDRQRGYVLFFPSYLQDLLPGTLPPVHERGEGISMSACRAEYESACFAVHPFRELADCSIRIDPLREAHGNTIGPEAFDVRIVRWVAREQGRRRPPLYRIAPGYLTAKIPSLLPKGVTQWFWITVRVPTGSASGLYRGQVTFAPKNLAKTAFPLQLRVRPFELGPAAPMIYAHYYNAPSDLDDLAGELRTIQRYGSNGICVTGILHGRARRVDGGLVVDFSRADRFMQIYKRLGFAGPVLLFDFRVQGRGDWCNGERWLPKVQRHELASEEFFESARQMATIVRDHARQADWPDFYIYVSSELTRKGDTQGRLIDFGLRLLKTYRRVSGIKLCASINGPDEPRYVQYPGPGELAFWPYLDIIMYNAGVPINERTVSIRQRYPNCQLWFQNIGMTRYTEGYMPWKAGAVGRRQYKLDGRVERGGLVSANNAGAFYRVEGQFLATPAAERMREGVDDMRYIRTLERLIVAVRESERPEVRDCVAAAKKALRQIRETIRIDMSRASRRRGERPEFEDLRTYDRHRQRIAEDIVRLRAVLGRSGERLSKW